MRKRKKSIEAFSLVEVTIALGVVVFCLVSVFGLLATGLNVSQTASSQTVATHLLSGIASDIQSTPKGITATNSVIYNIAIPASLATSVKTAIGSPVTSYLGDDGMLTNSAAGARFQMNVWTSSAGTNSAPSTEETQVRVVLSWPAVANYTNAQGYVESIIAVNRTP